MKIKVQTTKLNAHIVTKRLAFSFDGGKTYKTGDQFKMEHEQALKEWVERKWGK